jgi:hypothetical protein
MPVRCACRVAAVKSYGPGDSFGDLALLYNTPRAASIKCTQSGTLWALDRATFRVILMSQKQSSDHTMLEFLRSIPLFSSLTTEQCVRVASVVNVLKFSGGEHVVRQGDHADSIYLIKEGSVVCSRRGEEDKYPLHMGDVRASHILCTDCAPLSRRFPRRRPRRPGCPLIAVPCTAARLPAVSAPQRRPDCRRLRL